MLSKILSRVLPAEHALSDRHYPASNTAATKTLAASVRRYQLHKVVWSYSGDPTGGELTVEDGSGNYIRRHKITKGGPGSLTYQACLGSANTAMIVTLAAGGAGITGTLDFEYDSNEF